MCCSVWGILGEKKAPINRGLEVKGLIEVFLYCEGGMKVPVLWVKGFCLRENFFGFVTVNTMPCEHGQPFARSFPPVFVTVKGEVGANF